MTDTECCCGKVSMCPHCDDGYLREAILDPLKLAHMHGDEELLCPDCKGVGWIDSVCPIHEVPEGKPG